MAEEEDRPARLVVASAAAPSGGYVCQLQIDDKPVRDLDRDQATAYATEVMWAVVTAEYDAAVFAQMSRVGLEMPLIGVVIRSLRNSRRPLLAAATHPLEYTPIVSHRDAQPRLTVRMGELIWQWELDDARQHLQHVMEVSATVDMDAAYRAELRKAGLDEEAALGYVATLREDMVSYADDAG